MSYGDKIYDPRWTKARADILVRDHYTCQHCGATDIPIQVHHLHYADSGNPWDSPPEDLLTLCKHCHYAAHTQKSIRNLIRTFLRSVPEKLHHTQLRLFAAALEQMAALQRVRADELELEITATTTHYTVTPPAHQDHPDPIGPTQPTP